MLSAAAMRSAIAAELRQPQYAWHGAKPWPAEVWLNRILRPVLRPFDWMGRRIAAVWDWIVHWLQRLFQHLGLGGGSASHAGPSHLAPGAWIVAGICLLSALVLWRWRSRPTLSLEALAPTVPIPIDVAQASPTDQAEAEWLALAQQLLAAGDLRLAVRAAFLATLAGLGQRGLLALRRDRTNREYFQQLQRRAARTSNSEVLLNGFRAGIRVYDEVWFGARAAEPSAVEAYVRAQRDLLAHV